MSAIEEAVIEKIRQRAEAGLKKYGVTMERGDLSTREWLVHAQEEALDLCVYLERAIRDLDAAKPKAEPTKAVDLSKCKRGDKLRTRGGAIFKYGGKCHMICSVLYPHVVNGCPHTNDGRYWAHGGTDDRDIIEVIGQ